MFHGRFGDQAARAPLPDSEGPENGEGAAQPLQPQAPPQQPPPPPIGAGPGLMLPEPLRPTATVDSSFTVSPWPAGQAHGSEDSLIGRVTSNVSPQARHRYS
jgi:hypothetical protein